MCENVILMVFRLTSEEGMYQPWHVRTCDEQAVFRNAFHSFANITVMSKHLIISTGHTVSLENTKIFLGAKLDQKQSERSHIDLKTPAGHQPGPRVRPRADIRPIRTP